ncbi:MAG: DNA-directed RNA polymerase subunit omega [Terriglobales bacterium]|jgi:hypothetical protein
MRSDKIFGALDRVQNRYKLCQLTAQATRKFHRPNTRVQETMNEVLERFSTSADLERKRAAQEMPVTAQRHAA